MRYLWSHFSDYPIRNQNYEGLFYQKGSDILFYYADDDIKIIHCNQYDENGYTGSQTFQVEPRVWPPHDWHIIETQNTLMCSELIGIDLCHNTLLQKIPSSTVSELWKRVKKPYPEEKYKNGRGLSVSDYYISLSGECTIRCEKSKVELWKKRMVGYLYTDIFAYNDCNIFFGTDGNGGKFYDIDLETGTSRLEINTGGTHHFVIENGICYFLNLKTAEIMAVSLCDGTICDRISLVGKVNDYSRLFLGNQKLFAVSFDNKRGTERACMNCVSLSV